MFAAGEIMAGNVLGRGYAAGIGMTIGSVFGRIAGREAAAHARQLSSAHRRRDADLAEADRLMTICNSCRYCEGLCAVFPAMEMRRAFADGDLNYLANLCHGCGACYHDCQFSPPHEFNVNVPRTLARVRAKSYAELCVAARALAACSRATALAIGHRWRSSVAAFLIGFALLDDRAAALRHP